LRWMMRADGVVRTRDDNLRNDRDYEPSHRIPHTPIPF
jgi:hypothetical protein